MKIPPGASDLPHDHPSHPMYVVSDNNKIQVEEKFDGTTTRIYTKIVSETTNFN